MSTTAGATAAAIARAVWFPAFVVVGFMCCYLLPFHAATPREVPVAVAGPDVGAIATQLDTATPGGFDVRPAAPEQARAAVLDRQASAAYVATDRTLFVAGAEGRQLVQLERQAFAPVAAAAHGTLRVADVAPTASGDRLGTSVFYVLMGCNVTSYTVAMMLVQASALSRRTKLIAVVGFGVFAAVVVFTAATSMHAIAPNPTILPIGFLLSQAVAWTTFGLSPYVRRALPGVAMGLFVLLSVSCSGGALPVEMLGEPFRTLHRIMPLGNAIDAARGILYFHGVGVLRPVLVLLGWLLLGVVLVSARTWAVRRRLRRTTEPADPAAAGVGSVEITARVLDVRDETPVAEAVLVVTDADGQQKAHSTTDQDGRVGVVVPTATGTATVLVLAHDHEPRCERLDLDGEPVHRNYRLAAADAEYGAVVAAVGAGQ